MNYASKAITNARGQRFTAGKLGELHGRSRARPILLGPPYVFDKSNIDKFNF